MEFTNEQKEFIKNQLGKFFLQYSIVHSKNVVYRYYQGSMNTATIGQAKNTPNVTEFLGFLEND